MQEELIQLETAKLAKAKGFNVPCFHYYGNGNSLISPYLENGSSTDTEFRVDLEDLLENHNYIKHLYSAPTQSLLQKWLREIHNGRIVFVIPVYRGWSNNLCNTTNDRAQVYPTYEEALEAGLLEALSYIKGGTEPVFIRPEEVVPEADHHIVLTAKDKQEIVQQRAPFTEGTYYVPVADHVGAIHFRPPATRRERRAQARRKRH